jgi:hypothetical protein
MEDGPDQEQAGRNYDPQQSPYQGYQPPYGNQWPYSGGPAVQPPPPQDWGSALRELPAQWRRVLMQPSAATFAQEQPKATWGMLWVMLIGYAVIAAILGAIRGAAFSATLATLPGFSGASGTFLGQILAVSGGFGAIIGVPIGFFIGQGILFGIARLFGGMGTFRDQGYLSLLFTVPLGILASLIGFIPVLGALIGLVIAIYQIVLQIFVIQAAHRLSGGKATAVVLLPLVIAIILAIILVAALAAIIIGASRTG